MDTNKGSDHLVMSFMFTMATVLIFSCYSCSCLPLLSKQVLLPLLSSELFIALKTVGPTLFLLLSLMPDYVLSLPLLIGTVFSAPTSFYWLFFSHWC